ncbi:MAG: exo-alpha-sialidase [Clostridiales bacterium]|nr:exo-alpha-sialidase [Clostridiales bacterium]
MKKLGMILALMMVCSMALPALAAPEYGELVTVATVDYDAQYWSSAFSYARVIELMHNGENNGLLISTCSIGTSGLHKERPGYPIYISRDGGSTWEHVTTVREKAAAIQSEWNPHLYELPCQLGDMPAGTLLMAACSIDSGHQRQSALRMYRSFDLGYTWEQFGTVAIGGGLTTGVWEPFIMMLPNGQLACYYSDSTEEPQYSQKMVMRLSDDGVNWGDPRNSDDAIDLVALEDQSLRPGMGVVAQMNDGRYIMVYEICDADNSNSGNPVHYKFSYDGIDWGDPADPGIKIVLKNGAALGSSPYIAYVPGYGENGLLLLTCGFQVPGQSRGNVVYVNDNLGDPDSWDMWYQPQNYRNPNGGYSRAIFAAADGKTAYFVNNIPDENSEEGYTKLVFMRYYFDETTYEPAYSGYKPKYTNK